MGPRNSAFLYFISAAALSAGPVFAQTAAPATGVPPPPPPPSFGTPSATESSLPQPPPPPSFGNPNAPAGSLPPPPPRPNLRPKNATPAPGENPEIPPPAPAPIPSATPDQNPAPTGAPTPPAKPGEAPWKILFDGTTVNGLRGLQKPDFLKSGWKISDGALTLSKEIKDSGRVTGGNLITTEAYTDFEFSFEWKLEVAGKSGVIYLARADSNQNPTGHVFYLIDDVRNPDGLKGGPIKRTGALYGVLAPGPNKQLNDGKWNEGSIRVQGNHVEHWINKQKVLEYQLGSAALKSAVQAHKARVNAGFGTKVKAPIVLLDAGEDVAFRNLKIRALPPQ